MDKLDYKKSFKELYEPKTAPGLIDVPRMTFIGVDGKGNPNEPEGEYQRALELLYAFAYTIKMAPKSGNTPENYFEYVVPPLEGLWWFDDGLEINPAEKDRYCWTSMIRQPEFVTQKVFDDTAEAVRRKKPGVDTKKARLMDFTEGLCVQCMHIGSYDEEPATLEKMKVYMNESGFACDLSDTRRHHEIYLGDPRRVEASKRKTILRYPVRRK